MSKSDNALGRLDKFRLLDKPGFLKTYYRTL